MHTLVIVGTVTTILILVVGNHPKAQATGEAGLRRAGHIAQFIDAAQDFAYAHKHVFAKGCEPHATGGALQERCAEAFLQLFDLHG